jgi:hypothetical protein
LAVSIDSVGLRAALANADTLAGIRAVAPGAVGGQVPAAAQPQYLRGSGARQTLGQWGGRENPAA